MPKKLTLPTASSLKLLYVTDGENSEDFVVTNLIKRVLLRLSTRFLSQNQLETLVMTLFNPSMT
jgi:hypothetical protein